MSSLGRFTFKVTGHSEEQVQKRVAEHIAQGAVLVGQIKKEYHESKNYNPVAFRNLNKFEDNCEATRFIAVMTKESVVNEKRKNKWEYWRN